MLLKKDHSCLILVDVQEKLAPLVLSPDALIDRCHWLMRLANELQVPMLVSEQYPKGLGHTTETLQPLYAGTKAIEKVSFSCWQEPDFQHALRGLNKNQVILIGMETHVCVLQTALDLIEADYEVFIVVDAVSSRHEQDYRYGLKRMKQCGAELVTSEMVFFEWIGQAGTPEFKALSKSYLTSN